MDMIRRFLLALFAVMLHSVGTLVGQERARHDILFVSLPYASELQGIEMTPWTGNQSRLFVGYDEGSTGVIIQYACSDEGGLVRLEENRRFHLPLGLDHPNDILLRGDSMLVVGWSRTRVSHLAWLNLSTGAISGWITDTVAADWWLQDAFIYEDTLFRVLTNSHDVVVQRHDGIAWTSLETYLIPSPYHTTTNFIQGVKVVMNRYLFVLTSFPSRIDIFEIPAGFQFVKSIYAENVGEAEGLSVIEGRNGLEVYYGLNQPNRIRKLSLRWGEIPDPIYPKGLHTPYEGPVRFECYPVNGCRNYRFQVLDESVNVVKDTTVSTPWVTLEGLEEQGLYRWNVAARFLNDSARASAFTTFSLVKSARVHRRDLALPTAFVVNQNYPNPFNAQTRVRLSIPAPSHVKVTVFDMIGRAVHQLLSSYLEPGVYDVLWFAQTESSGSYVIEVVAGHHKKSFVATIVR